MNSTLAKRIIRNIYKNIKSYISIIIISCIAVLFYTGLEANYHYLANRANKEMSDSNIADNYVTVNSYDSVDTLNLENDLIYDSTQGKYIESSIKYEVEDVEERFYSDAYYEERQVFLIASKPSNKMNVPALITEGDYNDVTGVLISEAYAKRRKIKVGDTIPFTIKASISDFYYDSVIAAYLETHVKEGKENIYVSSEFTIEFRISGFMKHAEAVGRRASNPGVLYMSSQCLKTTLMNLIADTYELNDTTAHTINTAILSADIYNQYLIRGGNLSAIRKYFSSKEKNNLLLATPMEELPTLSILLVDVENTKSISYTFPIIFYVCAVLIVAVTIMKEIDNEEANIGLLNALGIEKWRIALHYSCSTITCVLLGGLIGLIFGPIFIPWMMNLKYNALYSLVETKSVLYYPSYFVIFVVFISVALITALVRVYRYLSISPKDAMNKNHKSRTHSINFNFLPAKAYNLKMALRNIFWSPLKSLLVIVGVLGCSALLLASMGVEDTTSYGVDQELNEKLKYDIDISYNHSFDVNTLRTTYSEEIEYLEDYQLLVVMAFNDTELIDTTMTIIQTDSKCLSIPLKNGGCTITRKVAQALDLKEGDILSFYVKNKVYEIEVGNVTDMFMSQSIYISKDDFSAFDTVQCNRAFINCTDNANVKELSKAIQKTDGVIFSRTKAQRRNTAQGYLEMLGVVTNIIKIFAIILAVAVIYDLVSLNYKERIRDIAQIKVMGFGYATNMKTLLYEIGILSSIGAILGMTLGKPMMITLLELNENAMISFTPHIYKATYVIAFLLTIGVAILLNLALSLRINKLDMVKSIKGAE